MSINMNRLVPPRIRPVRLFQEKKLSKKCIERFEHELLVQSIPCARLVNQSKHQSDHVFERNFLVYNL